MLPRCKLALLLVVAAGCAKAGPTRGLPQAGASLPELTFTDLDGGSHTLAELEGKVVLLDFWATWCGPCKLSLPIYDAWQTEIGEDTFAVVAVSVDDTPDHIPRFATRHMPHVTVWWDQGQAAAATLALPAMPTAFILDADSVVTLSKVGFEEREADEIRGHIDQLLAR